MYSVLFALYFIIFKHFLLLQIHIRNVSANKAFFVVDCTTKIRFSKLRSAKISIF